MAVYLQNETFLSEWYNCKKTGVCSDLLLKFFTRIAKRYVVRFPPTSALDRDAVVNYAVSEAWLKWDKFDPEQSNNIFAYFTQMIKNDMITHYNELNKGRQVTLSLDVFYNNFDKGD